MRTTPELIQSISGCTKVSAGNGHSLVLTNTSQVYSFGTNRWVNYRLIYYRDNWD